MGGVVWGLVVSVPAFLLMVFTVADVVRRRDLTVARTTLWLALVLVLPVVGTLLYLLARPLHVSSSTSREEHPRVTRLLRCLDERDAGLLDDAQLHGRIHDLLRAD